MTRYEANMKIVLLLQNYLEMNKDTRFQQALFNLKINEFETRLDLDSGFDRTLLKDKYNEESRDTLKKLENI